MRRLSLPRMLSRSKRKDSKKPKSKGTVEDSVTLSAPPSLESVPEGQMTDNSSEITWSAAVTTASIPIAIATIVKEAVIVEAPNTTDEDDSSSRQDEEDAVAIIHQSTSRLTPSTVENYDHHPDDLTLNSSASWIPEVICRPTHDDDEIDQPMPRRRPPPAATSLVSEAYAPGNQPIVCQCCYDHFEESDMLACSDGLHQFCKQCLRIFIENFVYGEPYPLRDNPQGLKSLPCLACDEKQGGILPGSVVQQAVSSTKVWEDYQERIFRLMAMSEEQEDDWKNGDSKVAATPVGDSDSIESSQQEGEPDISREVEEAMTEAKLRRCPFCSTPFMKGDGCNKMNCPSCGASSCYCCRERVDRKGYAHFCRHSYDTCIVNCGKCPLWTTEDERLDQKNMMNAINEANQKWEAALLGGESSDENEDIDSQDDEKPPPVQLSP